jgi:ABC-type sulfate transport system permease component
LNWQAIALSLKLAVSVAGILLVAGLPIAYWVTFSRWRWKFLIEAVVALPLVLPPTVLGYYILVGLGPRTFAGKMWQSWFGHTLPFTFGGLLIASVLYSLPFAVQPFSAGFETVDRRLIEAAWTLGASQPATFFRVILPLSAAGAITGAGRQLRRGESHGAGSAVVFLPCAFRHLWDKSQDDEPLAKAIDLGTGKENAARSRNRKTGVRFPARRGVHGGWLAARLARPVGFR